MKNKTWYMKYIIYIGIYALLLIGEVKCCIKAWNCNWEPIGKAEIIYTASACCGLGAFVGWFTIEDK